MSRAVPNPNITVRNFFIAVQEAGHWVLLQNCHLAASWLPTLDKKVAAAAAAAAGGGSGPRPHGNYRLWLTAFPTASFPVGVLQVRGTAPLAQDGGGFSSCHCMLTGSNRLVPSQQARLLGSFLWYRPGLRQCRFRKGLYRGSIARFAPASDGLAPPASVETGSTTASHQP
jgi:hypothetical protein